MGEDDLLFSQLQNAEPSIPYLTGTDELPFPSIEDVASFIQGWMYTHDLPLFQLEAGLYAQGMSHNSSIFHWPFFFRVLL